MSRLSIYSGENILYNNGNELKLSKLNTPFYIRLKGLSKLIDIGKERELLCDDHIIDTGRTTASHKIHGLTRMEAVLVHDAPWEGDGCDYHNFFYDDEHGIYRMYYLGWNMINNEQTRHTCEGIRVCYAESCDGLHWVKPNLGICDFDGSNENNIILDPQTNDYDNFMVFMDKNPDCPPEEKYKGIASYTKNGPVKQLWCFISGDGIHFKAGYKITDKGMFDSLNTVIYDGKNRKYIGYIRGFHNIPGDDLNKGIRDIRYIESFDFKTWSEPVPLDFMGGEDYPLYTNCVSRYYRAPHILLGFPTRYVERSEWNGSFEELCGKEKRKIRMKLHPRYGLAVTDCVFMSSRDGICWKRYDEAFIRPGAEEPHNWVYGDCYPTLGMVETAGSFPGTDNEISMFIITNHWMGIPSVLYRYAIRLDGFVSVNATYKPKILATKPFIYNGGELHINFSTSARGYMFIKLKSESGREIESCELFGDSTDRKVYFTNGNVADLAGQAVVMEISMSDADIYSFIFR